MPAWVFPQEKIEASDKNEREESETHALNVDSEEGVFEVERGSQTEPTIWCSSKSHSASTCLIKTHKRQVWPSEQWHFKRSGDKCQKFPSITLRLSALLPWKDNLKAPLYRKRKNKKKARLYEGERQKITSDLRKEPILRRPGNSRMLWFWRNTARKSTWVWRSSRAFTI